MKTLSKPHVLKTFLIAISLTLLNTINAQETKEFSNIKEVFILAKDKNYSFQNAVLQTQLANLTKKTAVGNAFSPKIPASAQIIDNFNQQVSFFPGEAFGLPPGTFKKVTIGQQFVSTFSIQPQFDIINLANIVQIKTAKINQQLVENQNKINEQKVYEQINGIYFNILSFNGQKETIIENINIAENILRITTNKFKEGIARKQEVNEAEVNLIQLQDKLEQVEINIKIQYENLDLFFENKYKSSLTQNIWAIEKSNSNKQIHNDLEIKNTTLQTQFAKQEYRSLKFQNLPVLSFISSFNWQNLSNENFFAKNSNWMNYNYAGLKLSYDFPTTVQKLSNLKSKKIQLETVTNNAIHTEKENENRNNTIIFEYEKTIKQEQNFQKIYALKKDTYEKNFNQYKENILALDKLLISQNDMIMSKLNLIMIMANRGYNATKIEIYNGL